ncbi:hypothetical protein GCM10010244_82460 [Streptomyces coeruleorubidus]|nr:hypothetical protein GCM10010244_82460 [Streptomyces bellus]
MCNVFAGLWPNRDRALLAFWVSNGAAPEAQQRERKQRTEHSHRTDIRLLPVQQRVVRLLVGVVLGLANSGQILGPGSH